MAMGFFGGSGEGEIGERRERNFRDHSFYVSLCSNFGSIQFIPFPFRQYHREYLMFPVISK
jgi:hypothetical protein